MNNFSQYLDTGTKREDATGKEATSMLKDAILLSVVMLLLCAVNHAHGIFSAEEQGAGVTRGFFSQRRKIVGLKLKVAEMFCSRIRWQYWSEVSIFMWITVNFCQSPSVTCIFMILDVLMYF